MTTLQPRPPYTEAELARLYPKDMELQQVQILLRHGERTPVSARFKNAGLPAYWPYCHAANAMRSVVLEADASWDHMKWKRRLENLGPGDIPILNPGPRGELDAICLPGELTDLGRETTLALGERIRKLYIDQLGFLPSVMNAGFAAELALRSTPIPRALESVQQAFTGLYPPSARASGLAAPVIVTRHPQDETLFPNEGACKRFAELANAFADRTAQLYSSGPELAYINKKISMWMPKDSPVVKVDSHPRLSGVMDTINASLAHGGATKLPTEFYDKKVLENVDKVCVEEWFVGYVESNEYRKLGIGAVVGDLAQKMVEHVNHSKPSSGERFKISLNGCHDTTIGGVLASIGAFDIEKNKWPNFTSNIAVELFKRKGTNPPLPSGSTNGAIWPSKEKTWWSSFFSLVPSSMPVSARTPIIKWPDAQKTELDDYYVRMRYNDNPVTIPFCKPAGRHLDGDESFCTLAAFKEAADMITPKDWKAECKMNLGAPAMNGAIERPPGL